MYVCIYLCICVYVGIHIYVYIYIHIYIYVPNITALAYLIHKSNYGAVVIWSCLFFFEKWSSNTHLTHPRKHQPTHPHKHPPLTHPHKHQPTHQSNHPPTHSPTHPPIHPPTHLPHAATPVPARVFELKNKRFGTSRGWVPIKRKFTKKIHQKKFGNIGALLCKVIIQRTFCALKGKKSETLAPCYVKSLYRGLFARLLPQDV